MFTFLLEPFGDELVETFSHFYWKNKKKVTYNTNTVIRRSRAGFVNFNVDRLVHMAWNPILDGRLKQFIYFYPIKHISEVGFRVIRRWNGYGREQSD